MYIVHFYLKTLKFECRKQLRKFASRIYSEVCGNDIAMMWDLLLQQSRSFVRIFCREALQYYNLIHIKKTIYSKLKTRIQKTIYTQ